MESASQLQSWEAQLRSVRERLAGAGVATLADLRQQRAKYVAPNSDPTGEIAWTLNI